MSPLADILRNMCRLAEEKGSNKLKMKNGAILYAAQYQYQPLRELHIWREDRPYEDEEKQKTAMKKFMQEVMVFMNHMPPDWRPPEVYRVVGTHGPFSVSYSWQPGNSFKPETETEMK